MTLTNGLTSTVLRFDAEESNARCVDEAKGEKEEEGLEVHGADSAQRVRSRKIVWLLAVEQ